MTNFPRSFCPECMSVIDAGSAIHGLTKEHYECYNRRTSRGHPLREEIRDKAWTPKPDKLEGAQAVGWLSTDGNFYGCRSYQHIALGGHLAEYFYNKSDSSDLEKRGWGHISDIGFYYGLGVSIPDGPTQPQLDTLWDWFRTLKDGDKPFQGLKWFFELRSKEIDR